MQTLPCLLCGNELHERTDKNMKPYFICDPCGVQLFIRRKQGRENLKRLCRSLRLRDLPMREHAFNLFKIRAILEELDGVEQELDKLDSFNPFSDNKTKKQAREILKKRQQTLLDELERVTAGPKEG